MTRPLLVLVLLSPWLAAVWVGFHNLRQPRQLQLLTGTTPALSIGVWLLLSSSLGVTLGAGAVGILLQAEGSSRHRRRSRASLEENARDEDNPDPIPGYWQDTESGLGKPPPIMDVPFRVVSTGRQAPSSDTPSDPDPSPSSSYDSDGWESSQEDW